MNVIYNLIVSLNGTKDMVITIGVFGIRTIVLLLHIMHISLSRYCTIGGVVRSYCEKENLFSGDLRRS